MQERKFEANMIIHTHKPFKKSIQHTNLIQNIIYNSNEQSIG